MFDKIKEFLKLTNKKYNTVQKSDITYDINDILEFLLKYRPTITQMAENEYQFNMNEYVVNLKNKNFTLYEDIWEIKIYNNNNTKTFMFNDHFNYISCIFRIIPINKISHGDEISNLIGKTIEKAFHDSTGDDCIKLVLNDGSEVIFQSRSDVYSSIIIERK